MRPRHSRIAKLGSRALGGDRGQRERLTSDHGGGRCRVKVSMGWVAWLHGRHRELAWMAWLAVVMGDGDG